MKSRMFLVLSLVLGLQALRAEPPAADELIAQAGKQAAAEKKAVYVHFGASWCGWCRRHEAFLDRPDIKPVFAKYFVPLKLVVQENDGKKELENPGADTWFKKLGGPAGLPFSAFVDARGGLIVNSRSALGGGSPAGNIGHPMTKEEIEWFVEMMKQAAPAMAADDLRTIDNALRTQKR